MSSITTISAIPPLASATLSSTVTRNAVGQLVHQITEDRVRECFDRDLETAIGECRRLYGEGSFGELPDEVQQILVNMMFNMGRPRLSKFKNFNAAIEEHDWARAAVEGRDSLWYRQVTNRAERLMSRMENVG